MKSLAERFWSKVEKGDACWLWVGKARISGYGAIQRGGRADGVGLSHRVSWELTNGPIPDGLYVCHRCDVRLCVRPDHLFLGTQQDNLSDAKAKGRMGKGPAYPRGMAHPNTRITDEQVAEMRRRAATGERHRDIAADFGVDRSYIGLIQRGFRN